MTNKQMNDKSSQVPRIKYIGKQPGDLGIGDKMPNDKAELDVIDIFLEYMIDKTIGVMGNAFAGDSRAHIKKYAKSRLIAILAKAEQRGEVRGMEQAKSRVLRRTEIPSDAKNPTRDWVVVLGEQIADIIDGDINQLKGTK